MVNVTKYDDQECIKDRIFAFVNTVVQDDKGNKVCCRLTDIFCKGSTHPVVYLANTSSILHSWHKSLIANILTKYLLTTYNTYHTILHLKDHFACWLTHDLVMALRNLQIIGTFVPYGNMCLITKELLKNPALFFHCRTKKSQCPKYVSDI